MRIGSNDYWLDHEPCISPMVDQFHPDGIGMRILGCNQDAVRRSGLGMAQHLATWRYARFHAAG